MEWATVGRERALGFESVTGTPAPSVRLSSDPSHQGPLIERLPVSPRAVLPTAWHLHEVNIAFCTSVRLRRPVWRPNGLRFSRTRSAAERVGWKRVLGGGHAAARPTWACVSVCIAPNLSLPIANTARCSILRRSRCECSPADRFLAAPARFPDRTRHLPAPCSVRPETRAPPKPLPTAPCVLADGPAPVRRSASHRLRPAPAAARPGASSRDDPPNGRRQARGGCSPNLRGPASPE